MSSSGIIIGLACNACSRFFSGNELIRIGESVLLCQKCYRDQRQVVESWADPPKECALCRTSFEDLIAANPGKQVSMFPHWMDGTFGMLCKPCDERYVLKRRDLYGNTRHGWERKIK